MMLQGIEVNVPNVISMHHKIIIKLQSGQEVDKGNSDKVYL